MKRWAVALAAALILPACGDGSGTVSDTDGRTPTTTPPSSLGTGQPPFIRIISPAPRSAAHEGATITIQAVALDPDAAIVQVNFFDGARFIGGKSSPPWFVAYGGLQAGTHVLTAEAIDIFGLTATSSPVTVFVIRRG